MVRTAAIIVIAAVSGMRSSELMELRVGCRRPPQQREPRHGPLPARQQRRQGTAARRHHDEWVVIEPVYQAIELAEQLHDDPRDGRRCSADSPSDVRYQWFRDWVNGPAGQRLGIAPIPDDPVTPSMLAEPWRWSSPTGPAACSQRNFT